MPDKLNLPTDRPFYAKLRDGSKAVVWFEGTTKRKAYVYIGLRCKEYPSEGRTVWCKRGSNKFSSNADIIDLWDEERDNPKPLEFWVNVYPDKSIVSYTREETAKKRAGSNSTRIAVHIREVIKEEK